MRDVITANPQIRYRTVIRNYKSSLWPKKTVSQWVMGHARSRVNWMMGHVGHGSQNVTHCQLWLWARYHNTSQTDRETDGRLAVAILRALR